MYRPTLGLFVFKLLYVLHKLCASKMSYKLYYKHYKSLVYAS